MKPKRLKVNKAPKGQYPNALKKSDFEDVILYAELEGFSTPEEPKYLYFRPVPAAVKVPMEDPQVTGIDKWNMMVNALALVVVDPDTGQPLMTEAEWHQRDVSTLKTAIGAIFGIKFGSDDEDDDSEVLTPEEQARLEELAKEPNPLEETHGLDSHTAYISSSEEGPTETET